MAISLNKVTLIGNLGADPEIRTMSNGKDVATLRLATTDSWKEKGTGERREKTEWHRVVVFNEGLVAVIKALVKKGARLYIEGSLSTRKWQDASGSDKFVTEVVLNNFGAQIILLSNQSDNIEQDEYANKSSIKDNYKASDVSELLDDEIPF